MIENKSGNDAIAETKKRIKTLTNYHNFMKAANSYYLKHKTMEGFECSTDSTLVMLTNVKQHGKPFTANNLASNKAKMNRLKHKLVDLQDAEMEGGG